MAFTLLCEGTFDGLNPIIPGFTSLCHLVWVQQAGWWVGRQTWNGGIKLQTAPVLVMMQPNTVLLCSFHFNEGLEERPSQDTTCIFWYMCTFIRFFLVHYFIFKVDFSCVNHHTHLCGWCYLYNHTLKTSGSRCSEDPQKAPGATQEENQTNYWHLLHHVQYTGSCHGDESWEGGKNTGSIYRSLYLSIHLSMTVSNNMFMPHPLISTFGLSEKLSPSEVPALFTIMCNIVSRWGSHFRWFFWK